MIEALRRVCVAALAVALLGLPSVALACPYCALRNGAAIEYSVLMGVMIAFPFVIFMAVLPVLRRASQDTVGHLPMNPE